MPKDQNIDNLMQIHIKIIPIYGAIMGENEHPKILST